MYESNKEQRNGTTVSTIRTGHNCVLTLETTGREWYIDAGDGALPCGEIYIAHVEEKMNVRSIWILWQMEKFCNDFY